MQCIKIENLICTKEKYHRRVIRYGHDWPYAADREKILEFQVLMRVDTF